MLTAETLGAVFMKFDRLSRQPFVGLALMAAIGIIAAELFSDAASYRAFEEALFALGALVGLWQPRLRFTYPNVALGFFLLHTFQIEETPGLRLAQELGDHPRTITAIGLVADEPKRAANGFATFLFRLESIELAGTALPSHATFLVRWRGEPQIADELKLFGMAEIIPPPRNPGEFNMREYLARLDVRRELFVRYPENGTVIRHHVGNPFLGAAQRSREWMQRVLCRSLDDSPDVQNFISGIVLGLRHQTREDIEEPFQQTGTLHLFAVAGLHVGIVASLLWIVSVVAQLPRKFAAALIIPLLLFYAAVTGLHVSSVRAAVMASILTGGLFFERSVFALNSLAAAAFVLLAWNSNELFSTGFQLSFAVVGAIILLAEPLTTLAGRWTAADPFLPRSLLGRWRRISIVTLEWLFRGSAVSLAAWIGSLLLLLWYFHLLTPISLLANLAVVPIAFFILAIALLSILTAPLSSWLSIVFNNANWLLARIVLVLVHWFAQAPGSHYYISSGQLLANSRCRITVLDVGTGAAVHVRAPGVDWLFDCGNDRDYDRILRQYLHAVGVNRLSGLVLSHGDSLHIGGAIPLLRDYPPRELINNRVADRSAVHRRLLSDARQQGIRPVNWCAGSNFRIASGLEARVFFPPPQFSATAADDETLVVQLSIAPAFKVLFTSDSGYATENALLTAGADLGSDILVKGQHHSGKSGSDAFLNAVHPKLIVATSRDFPESERIDDSWADRLRMRGIKLFRQDETGAVEMTFARHEWTARGYVSGEIFRSDNR